MGSEYKKYMVEMKLQEGKYRLWKHGVDMATCFVETYKNKRSIYFSVTNLQPSALLLSEAGREYHLVLLGSDDGQLLHKDFGPFFVSHKGEGGVFKKFAGPEITCYTHCLFLTLDRDGGGTETVYSGTLPFYQEVADAEKPLPEKAVNLFTGIWGGFFEGCGKQVVQAFSPEKDETDARWFRTEDWTHFPDCIKTCEDQARRYGHILLGEKENRFFAAIPGRFLREEQPCREEGIFTLWQPVRGGEGFFETLNDLTGQRAEEIFGYWICGIDGTSGAPFAL